MKGEQFYDEKGAIITPDVTYQVVKEEVSDKATVTKITQFIALDGQFDTEAVTKVMELSYQKAMQRTGFEYNNPANFYSCFIYPDKDNAETQLNWVGRFIKYHDNNVPVKDLNHELIKYCQIPPINQFGYDEPIRKEIFNALANESSLTNQQVDSIFKKYNLKTQIVDSIKIEGTLKGWAWRYWYKRR